TIVDWGSPKNVAGILTKCPNVTSSTEIDHALKGSRRSAVWAAHRLGPDHGSGCGIKAPQAALMSRGKEPPVFIGERRPPALTSQIVGPEDRAAGGIDGIDLRIVKWAAMFHRDEDPAVRDDWVRDVIAEVDTPLLSEGRHQARRSDRTGMRSVDLERERLLYRGLSRRRSREQNRDQSSKDDR